MPYINRTTIMGHLARDVEVKQTSNGRDYARFSLSTKRKVGKGEDETSLTTWHNIVVWGYNAKNVDGGRKGDVVFVEGYSEINEWTNKEGNQVKTPQVVADVVVLIRKDAGQGPARDVEDVPF